jgi:YfiH family protein
MYRLFVPENMRSKVTAFFTGKDPGADIAGLSDLLKIRRDHIYLPVQRHTDKVLVIDSSMEPKIADAVVTRTKGILIGVQVADCVPVLLHDPVRRVVAAVHAGWRGTALEILKKTILTLIDGFLCNPGQIRIALGPSIRQCCYEVDGEVIRAVTHATGKGEYFRNKGDKFCLDLASANRIQAIGMGVPESNIRIFDACTFCNSDKFFSYRYAGGSAGRQAGFIGIF